MFGLGSQSKEKREGELVQAGFRYALSLTHHRHDAEDIVQHAWLTLSRRYGQVENRAILFTAIRNHFYDRCRRGKIVHFEPIDADEDEEEVHVPAVAAETPGFRGDLDVLLAHLNAKEREVLFLHCVEGYTTREISEQTGRPRGTVLSLISRARKKLEALAAEEETKHERARR